MSTFLEVTADKILSRTDVQRLVKELEREKKLAIEGGGRTAYVTDYYMIRIALQTGLRISEVSELCWRDIRDGFLIVRYGKGKKKRKRPLDTRVQELERLLAFGLPPDMKKQVRKELASLKRVLRASKKRTVYFGQETQGLFNAFKAWQKSQGQPCGPDARLFLGARGPLTRYGIHERWAYWHRRMGLDDEITFHSIRHFYATWLLENGVPLAMVSRQLGHSNTIYTAGYLHHTTEARAVLVALL